MNRANNHSVSYGDALKVWIRVAILSFGGPAGQIAVMHRIIVDEKKWISESRFLHALNYCMLLPGPEAQQLATYIGWLLHRSAGGLTAGLLFILPGFLSILALSIIYVVYQNADMVQGLFFGLKAAVLAVVVEAVFRIGRRVIKNNAMLLISVLSFAAIFFLNTPFPLIILSAGIAGLLGGKFYPEKFNIIKGHASDGGAHLIADDFVPVQPTFGRSLRVAAIWLILWALPFFLIITGLGTRHVLLDQAVFFSKAAVVTFGGAYSVLSYVAQQAVSVYGWLQPGEMLDGLGMAETTPGPLIQVVQFVGFMGAYRNAAPFQPMTAAVLGSLVTTWVTFAPCFLWVFLGAPYVEKMRQNKILNSALSAITAAVVGVILNLAVWFSLHVIFEVVNESRWGNIRFFAPDIETINGMSALFAAAALTAILKFKMNALRVLGLSGLAGAVFYFLQGI